MLLRGGKGEDEGFEVRSWVTNGQNYTWRSENNVVFLSSFFSSSRWFSHPSFPSFSLEMPAIIYVVFEKGF